MWLYANVAGSLLQSYQENGVTTYGYMELM